MRDIKSPTAIWTKGALFLVLGIASAALLAAEIGTIKGCLLLAVCIWAFCRAYYFAFYVVERYADPAYRFSGLISFVRYLAHRKTRE